MPSRQLMCIGVGNPVGCSTNGSLGVTRHTIARRSANTDTYPARADPAARFDCGAPGLPYGVRITTAGAGSLGGRARSAASVMPSRNGIRTLNLRTTSGSATTREATPGPVSLRVSPRRPAAHPGREGGR
jgi:hypothetical protein